MMTQFPTAPEDFTAEFVERVLRVDADALLAIDHAPVGTGQVCDSYRFSCDWKDGASAERPASFIAKCPSHDAQSRGAAAMFHLYDMEVGWYRNFGKSAGPKCPDCYHAAISDDEQQFVLMLEDMAPAQQGDQLAGASLIQVESTLLEAAALHSISPPSSGFETVKSLTHGEANAQLVKGIATQGYPAFRERFSKYLDGDILDMGQALVDRIGDYIDHQAQHPTITHGDMRLDNILFHDDGRLAALVDWQTCSLGNPASDVAYLIGTSFASAAERRAHEEALLDGYLRQCAALGNDMDRDAFWRDYRRAALSGFVMAINASLTVEATERGDAMFAAMALRPAQMALDHDSISLI